MVEDKFLAKKQLEETTNNEYQIRWIAGMNRIESSTERRYPKTLYEGSQEAISKLSEIA